MGVYKRSYMRRGGGSFGSSDTPFLKWIIIINAALFVLPHLFSLIIPPQTLTQFFALSSPSLGNGYVWTLLTYAFLHADLFHILFNMLMVFFVGRILEPFLGSQKFLKLYIICALAGGLTWLLINMPAPNPLVGASGAAFGLMTFFCLLHPDRPLTFLLFFVLPVRMKPKWLLLGMLAIELFLLLFYEIPGKTRIASSAHLGGIVAGMLMYNAMLGKNWFSRLKSIAIEKPKWASKSKSVASKFNVNVGNRKALKEEVNRVLDKINTQGFGSLSEKEKQLLDKAKDILRK